MKPRTAGKQTQRSNAQADTAYDYYRINMFLTFVDRFSSHEEIVKTLCHFIPSRTIQTVDTNTLFESDSSLLVYEDQLSWRPKSYRSRI